MIETLDGLHGAYTYRLARQTWGDHRLRRAVESGELVGFGRSVLLDAERVLDLRSRCAGALLLTDCVGVIAGPTAAALHGCTAVGGFPVHVRVPYAHRFRSRPGLVVHQGPVPPQDVVVLDGLRVLPPDLAVAEVLCTAPRRAALACADQALRRLAPEDRPGFVADVTARLAGRADRRGTRQAAAVLSLATGRPETPTQSALLLVLAGCGLPAPECQYPVPGEDGSTRHRLDFAWPECRVAVECDDESPPGPSGRDLARRGWLIIRADHQDLADPTALSTRLRTALQDRRQAA